MSHKGLSVWRVELHLLLLVHQLLLNQGFVLLAEGKRSIAEDSGVLKQVRLLLLLRQSRECQTLAVSWLDSAPTSCSSLRRFLTIHRTKAMSASATSAPKTLIPAMIFLLSVDGSGSIGNASGVSLVTFAQ